MQNKPGMTQSGFNRRQKAGFNYRVADSEMKAGAVRCCISMVPAASCSYQPLLEIAVLVCQGVSRASITSTEIRVSSERLENTVCILIVLSILDEFSHSLFYFVLVDHYPMGQRQLHFHDTLHVYFMPNFENHGRGRLTEMWTAIANSSSSKELHAPDVLLLVVSMLYSLAFIW